MGLHDWKAKFAPAILERGENYFHNGAVRSLEWEDEQIHAVVSGERDYHVHISVIIVIQLQNKHQVRIQERPQRNHSFLCSF